jgi:hypothetical protein
MSSRTQARRSSTAATGRFSRSGAARNQRRRPAAPQRRGLAGGWLQRSQPTQSRVKRMLSGVTGALPGASKGRSTSSSKSGRRGKAGGLALLAGAAGVVFKNRDKLASLARRNDAVRNEHSPVPDATPVTPPAAGPTSAGSPQINTGPGDAPKL